MVEHDKKIMHRLSEHLDAVKEKHPEWVGIFLQGSQNYKLDYEGSDVDSKLIVLPSFEDFVLNRKPQSYTHIMENDEHVDVKDIRLMFDCFRKQNINFVEILFTKYRILNPKYESLFYPVLNARELIGRYNDFASLNCMVGTAMEKQKALCHPYPATMDKIERFGYDPKQLHHILRLEEFMTRWLDGEPYEDCLLSKKTDCYLMATPFSECVERSKCRERVVPYEVLERMYKSIWIPQYYEGWDRIEIVYQDGFKTLDTKELFWGENGLAWINQDNPHHNLTVGAHCIATYANIHGGSPELYEAAMLHDIGKPFTKAFKNSKGDDTDIAHYYEHHHVSAYDSLFYISPALDVLYVAGLIQWHMRPFELERVPKSQKALEKFKRLIGEKMYNDVMVLHEADIKAKGTDAEDAA